MHRFAATLALLALLALPTVAAAQSPSPLPNGNVPHVHPAPGHSPIARRPAPHPSGRPNQTANHATSHAPYQARINLTGEDVQKILATPSPGPKPTKAPPNSAYPEPETFHDTHN